VLSALFVINVVILILLVLCVKPLARLAYVNPRILGLAILALCFVGAYSAANSMYFVLIAIVFGVFGLVCARANIPTIPLILGMVMGDTLESALRQALGRSDGSLMPFIERPIAASILAVMVLMLVWPWLSRVLIKSKE
jgi:putative tricarboxylic transport membrane protein